MRKAGVDCVGVIMKVVRAMYDGLQTTDSS